MNAEAIRARVFATLSPDANVRRAAEIELKAVCLLSSSLFAFLQCHAMLCHAKPDHFRLTNLYFDHRPAFRIRITSSGSHGITRIADNLLFLFIDVSCRFQTARNI